MFQRKLRVFKTIDTTTQILNPRMPSTRSKLARGNNANAMVEQPPPQPSSSISFTEQYMRVLDCELNKLKDDEAAKKMKGYMRQQFDYIGISMPVRRKLHARVMKQFARPNCDQLMQTIRELWSRDFREYQYCGIDLAIKYCDTFNLATGDNDAELLQSLKFIGDVMIRQKSWWDTVDSISSNVVGPLLRHHPKLASTVMSQWCEDQGSMWIRRCSLIFQLRYNSETDMLLLFRLCRARCHEKEFFIKKAIGWSLRQASKTHAPVVRKWADTNQTRLSNLSYKEATKYC